MGDAHFRAAFPAQPGPQISPRGMWSALTGEARAPYQGMLGHHSASDLARGWWLTSCFYKLTFIPTALSQTYMVSELQKLHSQLSDGQQLTKWLLHHKALTKRALTRQVLRSLLTHQLRSAQPASGQVSPTSALRVDFILLWRREERI